jgi:predicted Abi (CAAX) family protease
VAAVTIRINGLPVSYEHGAWMCLGVVFIVVVFIVFVVIVLFVLNAFFIIFFLVIVVFVDGDILAITEVRGVDTTSVGTRGESVIGIKCDGASSASNG